MINLPQRALNATEASILERGMKFNSNEVDSTSFAVKIETVLSDPTIPDDIRSDGRNMVSAQISQGNSAPPPEKDKPWPPVKETTKLPPLRQIEEEL